MDRETEVQKGKALFLNLHSWWVAKLEFEIAPGLSGLPSCPSEGSTSGRHVSGAIHSSNYYLNFIPNPAVCCLPGPRGTEFASPALL